MRYTATRHTSKEKLLFSASIFHGAKAFKHVDGLLNAKANTCKDYYTEYAI